MNDLILSKWLLAYHDKDEDEEEDEDEGWEDTWDREKPISC